MRFERDIHAAVWGEAEWLVSAHPLAPSRLLGESRTLRDVCPTFPLLIKKISAEQRLSVQVHPDEDAAKTLGGEPKSEMWYVLKSGPIYAGFRPGVTKRRVERAIAEGGLEELLVRLDAREGECYYIPAGLVHAIGAGTVVFEVQQSSDTTYRLCDWGRVGTDGQPRRLHVQEALVAMNVSLPSPKPTREVHCPYFDFHRLRTGEETPTDAWRVLSDLAADDVRLLPAGEVCVADRDALLVVCRMPSCASETRRDPDGTRGCA